MGRVGRGHLIIIGGHEDKSKDGPRVVLTEVCRRARENQGPLVLITTATSSPEESADVYLDVFHDLGVREVTALDLQTRADAMDSTVVNKLARASVVFFTGGDQLRITSQIADSP